MLHQPTLRRLYAAPRRLPLLIFWLICIAFTTTRPQFPFAAGLPASLPLTRIERGPDAGALRLGAVTTPGDLILTTDRPLILAADLIVGGRIALHAPSIRVAARIQAPNMQLHSDGVLDLSTQGALQARAGAAGGTIRLSADALIAAAPLDASGTGGGMLDLRARHVQLLAPIQAHGTHAAGGTLTVLAHESLVATTQADLDVSGLTRSGVVDLRVPGGTIFSSAPIRAIGPQGGRINLDARQIRLVAAQIHADSMQGGGQIRIGTAATDAVTITAATRMAADAFLQGDGGMIRVQAIDTVQIAGTARAHGGVLGGDGGRIVVLARTTLGMAADLDAGAPAGVPGSVLLDPQDLTIGVDGTFAQYALDDPTPATPGMFGATILPLGAAADGHVVVSDPYESSVAEGAGAVYLFDGRSAALISVLSGSNANDQVGSTISAVGDGNFTAISDMWHERRGAVTWGSGITGVNGTVAATNSLVGDSTWDRVGSTVTALADGHYVVQSRFWNANRGAVTWVNGSNGHPFGASMPGASISSANSLIGSDPGDQVGLYVVPLPNGAYVVNSPFWQQERGAVTWAAPLGGTVGLVTEMQSLVGGTAGDQIGNLTTYGNGIMPLPNGDYLVRSPLWNGQRGAITQVDGATGQATGESSPGAVVSAQNSLVLSEPGEQLGNEILFSEDWLTILANGNYVLINPDWHEQRGAVVWVDAAAGLTGTISADRALVGATPGTQIGSGGIVPLQQGNYLVLSNNWQKIGIVDTAALTWIDGATGIPFGEQSPGAVVSSINSISGGQSAVGLKNGNYVITGVLPGGHWGVTWKNGTHGISGTLTLDESLSTDTPGWAIPLTNGHYVVVNPDWHDHRGAVTWVDGTNGRPFGESSPNAIVSANNSLVGAYPGDKIGFTASLGGITALPNGHYVVVSPDWNGATGAVTWGNGWGGTVGVVSATNSLVGTHGGDQVGRSGLPGISGFEFPGIYPLRNGDYVVTSPFWNEYRGAFTWGDGHGGTTGPISARNSLIGDQVFDQLGIDGPTVLELEDGSYVLSSVVWHNGRGAVAWSPGGQAITGELRLIPAILPPVTHTSGLDNDIIADSFNKTFYARFYGPILVGVPDPNRIQAGLALGQSMHIHPAYLARTVEHGAAVRMEAGSDISLTAALTLTNPLTDSGALTLAAGRSITLSAPLTSDGALTLLANQPFADPDVAAQRRSGPASIGMLPGSAIATDGALQIVLADHPAGGTLDLRDLTAGAITLANATDTPTITLHGAVQTHTPGAPIAVTGALRYAPDAVFPVRISGSLPGQYDQIQLTGTLTLDTPTLQVSSTIALTAGVQLILIANDGTDPVVGQFDGLPEGTILNMAGQNYRISYRGGNGNDVTLTADAPPVQTVLQRVYLGLVTR